MASRVIITDQWKHEPLPVCSYRPMPGVAKVGVLPTSPHSPPMMKGRVVDLWKTGAWRPTRYVVAYHDGPTGEVYGRLIPSWACPWLTARCVARWIWRKVRS